MIKFGGNTVIEEKQARKNIEDIRGKNIDGVVISNAAVNILQKSLQNSVNKSAQKSGGGKKNTKRK